MADIERKTQTPKVNVLNEEFTTEILSLSSTPGLEIKEKANAIELWSVQSQAKETEVVHKNGGCQEEKGKASTTKENQKVFPWMLEYRKKRKGIQAQKQNKEKSPQNKTERQTVYTKRQLFELEKEFHTTPYLCSSKRQDLALKLGMSERQVKVWFQNRRMRLKKETKDGKTVENFSAKARERHERATRVLHYFNSVPTSALKSLDIQIDDIDTLDAIINSICLKRLPSSGGGVQDNLVGTRSRSNASDPTACFPYAEPPPYSDMVASSNMVPFKQSENSSFTRYERLPSSSNFTSKENIYENINGSNYIVL